MEKVTLGRTGLKAGYIGLELGPIRKLSFARAREAMDRAIDRGIDFYDLGLPDRETQKRIGHSIVGRRSSLVLAGSFVPSNKENLREDLQWMLRDLKTDYIDILQIHDPDFVLRPGEESGLYDALLSAKKDGYIRHIGITTGDPMMAMNSLEYGWYDTLQYPWSMDSEEEELSLLSFCGEADIGSISVPPESTDDRLMEGIRFMRRYANHLQLYLLDEGLLDRLSGEKS